MELVQDMTGVDSAAGVRAVRLRIPAKPEYIALCRLALTEAVSNSVRHAYGTLGEGQVDIRYELGPDRICVDVIDDGAGFDPEEAPSFDGDELSEGGLGIAIIRTIADDVEIESRPGVRGSRLRFVKKLT